MALDGVAQWIEPGPWTKGLPVRFQVPACVAGQVPSRGHVRGNHTSMFPSLFLPPFTSV